MKRASDFRSIARSALRGRWLLAVLVGLVAMLLGGTGSEGPRFEIHFNSGNVAANLSYAGFDLFRWSDAADNPMAVFLTGSIVYFALMALAMAVLYLILGSIVATGYAGFNLDLVDGRTTDIGALFRYFPQWKTMVAAGLWQTLFVLLWSLLLVIPGIVASYSYALTRFILAENPNLRAREAIALSKERMRGNRWRLFCLRLSFIGWYLLCLLTFGIGNLWLRPYVKAADAAFYRSLNSRRLA